MIMDKDEKVKLVVRIADDLWNRGNIDAADEIMLEDANYYGPHMPNGKGTREDWKRAITMYRSAFPDSHVIYEDLIVTEDTVVGRWTASATHSGDLPGLAPTGKPIKISGITIYRFVESKISEAWEELNMLGMWQQLGVINLPGPH
jgi:steroid delta-isomerase-like uncharacterized protein